MSEKTIKYFDGFGWTTIPDPVEWSLGWNGVPVQEEERNSWAAKLALGATKENVPYANSIRSGNALVLATKGLDNCVEILDCIVIRRGHVPPEGQECRLKALGANP